MGKGSGRKFKIKKGIRFLKEGIKEGFIDFWEGFQFGTVNTPE